MLDANGVKIKLFSTSWMGTVVKDIRRCFALRGVHFTSTLEVEYDPLLEHMRAQRSANIIHQRRYWKRNAQLVVWPQWYYLCIDNRGRWKSTAYSWEGTSP